MAEPTHESDPTPFDEPEERGPLNLEELDVDNRRVLLRVDFNAPLEGEGDTRGVADDTRIRAALPTIHHLLDRGARLILCSHLGRPKGEVVPELSMAPIAGCLAQHLGRPVKLPDEVVGDGVTKLVNDSRSGEIVLLENLRFHPGETQNDLEFAKALAKLCDAYVNDAFGTCHRAHASVVGVPGLVRDHAAGLLLRSEVEALGKVTAELEHPFVAVIGGAKVSDKLGVLVALTERLVKGDGIVIGGAMANTFLMAQGRELGSSLVERERLADCRRVFDKAAARDVRVILPLDLRCGTALDDATATVIDAGVGVSSGRMALDIGPRSEVNFASAIASAKTVFWNGPMGVFENPAFASGTMAMASAVAECPGFTIVGGGDSVAALNASGKTGAINHVSTGGGASLEFVEGRELPGILALS